VPSFINLGLWQYGKAEKKQVLQELLDARSRAPAIQMAATPVDAEIESLRFRRVVLRGEYEPERQILIDNRVYQERAGYHVITPFKLADSAGSGMRVLINRGWIPAPDDHRSIPAVTTPAGQIELSGLAVVPGDKFFTLGATAAQPSATAEWLPVWQNLDLKRYRASVAYPVQPLVVLLGDDTISDPASGFVREWPRPDENFAKNLSYAYQWFGFSGTLVVIYLAVNLKKLKK
jgi:surfeit locus 1 family protein